MAIHTREIWHSKAAEDKLEGGMRGEGRATSPGRRALEALARIQNIVGDLGDRPRTRWALAARGFQAPRFHPSVERFLERRSARNILT